MNKHEVGFRVPKQASNLNWQIDFRPKLLNVHEMDINATIGPLFCCFSEDCGRFYPPCTTSITGNIYLLSLFFFPKR